MAAGAEASRVYVGQALKWVDCQSLGNERLLPADEPFIAALQLLSSPASA